MNTMNNYFSFTLFLGKTLLYLTIFQLNTVFQTVQFIHIRVAAVTFWSPGDQSMMIMTKMF